MQAWKLPTCYDLALSPDGQSLAMMRTRVDLWSVETRKKRWSEKPFKNPSDVVFSPDGTRIAVKSTSGEIAVLDSASGMLVRNFQSAEEGEGSNVCFSPCGAFLIDGSWEGVLTVREIATGKAVFRKAHRGDMLIEVSHSADRSLFAVAHQTQADASGRKRRPDYVTLWPWPFDKATSTVHPYTVADASAATLSPCGTRLALVHCEDDFLLRVVDLATSKSLWVREYRPGTSAMKAVWSPCGRIVYGLQEHCVSVHDAATGTVLGVRPVPDATQISFSGDGTLVAYGSWTSGQMEDVDLASLDPEPEPKLKGEAEWKAEWKALKAEKKPKAE